MRSEKKSLEFQQALHAFIEKYEAENNAYVIGVHVSYFGPNRLISAEVSVRE